MQFFVKIDEGFGHNDSNSKWFDLSLKASQERHHNVKAKEDALRVFEAR
jgi:hypothetical protein